MAVLAVDPVGFRIVGTTIGRPKSFSLHWLVLWYNLSSLR